MWFTATLAIAMPLAFLVGSHWGINGIASAWLIAYPLMLIPLYRRAMRGLQMPARDYFAAVFPAVSATTIMTVAVLAVRRLFLVAWFSPVASLISSVLVGAAAYVAVLVIFHRHRVTKFAHLLKALRKGTLSPGV